MPKVVPIKGPMKVDNLQVWWGTIRVYKNEGLLTLPPPRAHINPAGVE